MVKNYISKIWGSDVLLYLKYDYKRVFKNINIRHLSDSVPLLDP